MTLVELLVVMAIIGLVLGVSVPGLVKYSQQVRLKTATRQVSGLVSLARNLAISTRTEHLVFVDQDAHEVTVTNLSSGEVRDQRVTLPSSISIEVQVGGQVAKEPRLVFRPTGSLTGRTTSLVLADSERELTVTVTATTGAVSVQ